MAVWSSAGAGETRQVTSGRQESVCLEFRLSAAALAGPPKDGKSGTWARQRFYGIISNPVHCWVVS